MQLFYLEIKAEPTVKLDKVTFAVYATPRRTRTTRDAECSLQRLLRQPIPRGGDGGEGIGLLALKVTVLNGKCLNSDVEFPQKFPFGKLFP